VNANSLSKVKGQLSDEVQKARAKEAEVEELQKKVIQLTEGKEAMRAETNENRLGKERLERELQTKVTIIERIQKERREEVAAFKHRISQILTQALHSDMLYEDMGSMARELKEKLSEKELELEEE